MKKLVLVLFIALFCALRCAPSFPTAHDPTVDDPTIDPPKPSNCELTTHSRVVRDGIKCPYTDDFTNGLVSVKPPMIECFKVSVQCE